jgi:hypothetical protein
MVDFGGIRSTASIDRNFFEEETAFYKNHQYQRASFF